MTIREQERSQRQRKQSRPSSEQRIASPVPRGRKRRSETKQERQKRLHRQHEERRQLQSKALERGHLVVFPFPEWCAMRGFSIPTGRRIIAAGKVKVTELSERRIGIRSDHDQEYLDSCLRDSA